MNRTEARHKIRREQFARIRATGFKTNAALAEKLGDGFSPSFVSQLLSGHRGIGDDVADKIEARLNLPDGYLDSPEEGETAEFARLYQIANEQGRALMRTVLRTVADSFVNGNHRSELKAAENRPGYEEEPTWIIGGPDKNEIAKRRKS